MHGHSRLEARLAAGDGALRPRRARHHRHGRGEPRHGPATQRPAAGERAGASPTASTRSPPPHRAGPRLRPERRRHSRPGRRLLHRLRHAHPRRGAADRGRPDAAGAGAARRSTASGAGPSTSTATACPTWPATSTATAWSTSAGPTCPSTSRAPRSAASSPAWWAASSPRSRRFSPFSPAATSRRSAPRSSLGQVRNPLVLRMMGAAVPGARRRPGRAGALPDAARRGAQDRGAGGPPARRRSPRAPSRCCATSTPTSGAARACSPTATCASRSRPTWATTCASSCTTGELPSRAPEGCDPGLRHAGEGDRPVRDRGDVPGGEARGEQPAHRARRRLRHAARLARAAPPLRAGPGRPRVGRPRQLRALLRGPPRAEVRRRQPGGAPAR